MWPHTYGGVVPPVTPPIDTHDIGYYDILGPKPGPKRKKKKKAAPPPPLTVAEVVTLAEDNRVEELTQQIESLQLQTQLITLTQAIEALERQELAKQEAFAREEAARIAEEEERLRLEEEERLRRKEQKRVRGILDALLLHAMEIDAIEEEEHLEAILAATYAAHYEIIPLAKKRKSRTM